MAKTSEKGAKVPMDINEALKTLPQEVQDRLRKSVEDEVAADKIRIEAELANQEELNKLKERDEQLTKELTEVKKRELELSGVEKKSATNTAADEKRPTAVQTNPLFNNAQYMPGKAQYPKQELKDEAKANSITNTVPPITETNTETQAASTAAEEPAPSKFRKGAEGVGLFLRNAAIGLSRVARGVLDVAASAVKRSVLGLFRGVKDVAEGSLLVTFGVLKVIVWPAALAHGGLDFANKSSGNGALKVWTGLRTITAGVKEFFGVNALQDALVVGANTVMTETKLKMTPGDLERESNEYLRLKSMGMFEKDEKGNLRINIVESPIGYSGYTDFGLTHETAAISSTLLNGREPAAFIQENEERLANKNLVSRTIRSTFNDKNRIPKDSYVTEKATKALEVASSTLKRRVTGGRQ
jgi:hypothetical protein